MNSVNGEQQQHDIVGTEPGTREGRKLHKRGDRHIGMRFEASKPLAKLFGWWLGIATFYLALVHLHDLRGSPRRSIIILLGAGFVYALACLWLHRQWSTFPSRTRKILVIAIVLGAIGFRVMLLAVPPSLSDDIYRYRWDGRVQAANLNPYTEPPASSELAALRDPLWLRINYPAIRTIYGPLAQWLFRVTYQLDSRPIAFQAMATLGDLLCIGLLFGCLRRWKLPEWRIALYAWSPLAILESASNGHFDSWPTAALMLGVLASISNKSLLSTFAFSAGTLVKTWPLIWLPLMLTKRPPWHIGLVAAVIVAGYLPFADARLGLLQPWLDYTGRWLFNDAGFFLLRSVTGSEPLAKAIAAAVGFGAMYAFWRRGTDPVRASYWLLLLAIFLLPAIHPWYLLWPLPLAAAALDIGWITLTALAPLSYWILVDANSTLVEPIWVRFAIWLPGLVMWLWQAKNNAIAAPPTTPTQASR